MWNEYLYRVTNSVPISFFKHTPRHKHNNSIQHKTWCSLTETQGFEGWLKITNYLLSNILLFFIFHFDIYNISACGQKEEKPKTTTF